MPLTRDKKIFLAFLAILVVVIFADLHAQWSFPDTHWPIEKAEKVKLRAEQPITQKFTAARDGLSRVKILFGNSDLGANGEMQLSVLDENCAELLRRVEIKTESLDSGNTLDFNFPRLPKSKDQTFCLQLATVGKKSANVFVVSNTLPDNKSLVINDQELAGQALAMRPAYRNATLSQNLTELNQRISQYKPWFLKHFFLTAITLGFLLLSLLVIVILILL